ncbi:hypothetical protein K470DRAFT_254876 [Piedraia hortae CBS 480.64]|uniref:F-box domain-containing protein n=1 Tax=Piedraia hortae CBS 480.64 TaxID=1314780 RepID=A0A6A7C7U6_9PEZI|nr:hypothetical protein K470DRAFT_254876 [Piedraia hortae CBS 480.64]
MVVKIFWHMEFIERMKFRGVCKSWQRIIDTTPSLWSDPDFSNTRGFMKSSTLQRAINLAGSRVISVKVGPMFDPDNMLATLTKLPSLRALIIPNWSGSYFGMLDSITWASNLAHLEISPSLQLTTETINTLFNIMPSLQSFSGSFDHSYIVYNPAFEFPPPRLTRLALYGGSSVSWEGFLKNLHRLRTLEDLTLCNRNLSNIQSRLPRTIDLTVFWQLKKVELLDMVCSPNQLVLPPMIRDLKLKFCGSVNGYGTYDGSRALNIFLPHLERLTVETSDTIFANAMEILGPDYTSSWANFKSFSLVTGACNVESVFLHPQLASLEDVRLITKVGVIDEDVEKLVSLLPNLVKADLSFSKITGRGIRALTRSGTVSHIVIKGCYDLTEIDHFDALKTGHVDITW